MEKAINALTVFTAIFLAAFIGFSIVLLVHAYAMTPSKLHSFTQAHKAGYCNTTCTGYGNMRTCNTYCY